VEEVEEVGSSSQTPRIQFFSMAMSDSSASPERRDVSSFNWYAESAVSDDHEAQHELQMTPPASPRSMSTRPRCRSLPADPRQSHNEQAIQCIHPNVQLSSQTWVRQGRGADIHSSLSHVDLGEFVEAQQALHKECAQLRQSQVVCLQAVRETASMVFEMHKAAEAEKEARKQEVAERAALQDDLRTVSSQMSMLAQGQRELQQCMMAMCQNWPPQQNALTPPVQMQALCSESENTDNTDDSQRDEQHQTLKSTTSSITSPAGAPSPLQPGHWQRASRQAVKLPKRAKSRGAGDGQAGDPFRQVVQMAATCVPKAEKKIVEQKGAEQPQQRTMPSFF
jgi:hypothetical protein